MYPPHFIKTMVLLIAAMVPTQVNAGSNNHHHEHKPHVHGVSEIQLVMSEHQIELNFESPANNILGFEHSAQSPKEKQKVLAAKEILSTAASLFTFKGTTCSPSPSVININSLLQKREKKHHEISAQYRFTCDSVNELESIQIQLFNYFENIAEIKIQWISQYKQGMEILTPNKQLLNTGQLL